MTQKNVRTPKQVQVTCIEKPYIYWRGKWREGIVAFLHDKKAFVQVTPGSCVVMEPSLVLRDGAEVGRRNKKYATGWIVDNRRHTTVTQVELHFGRLWGSANIFYFQGVSPKSKKPLVRPRYRQDTWDFNRVINSKHAPRFFHQEAAALLFAVRLAKQGLKEPAKKVKERNKAIAALEKKLTKALDPPTGGSGGSSLSARPRTSRSESR